MSSFCAGPRRHTRAAPSVRPSGYSGLSVPSVRAGRALSGIVRVNKKGRRSANGQRRQPSAPPSCVSAPSARDRDPLGVPFASGRLSPGAPSRRADRGKNARSASIQLATSLLSLPNRAPPPLESRRRRAWRRAAGRTGVSVVWRLTRADPGAPESRRSSGPLGAAAVAAPTDDLHRQGRAVRRGRDEGPARRQLHGDAAKHSALRDGEGRSDSPDPRHRAVGIDVRQPRRRSQQEIEA
jgi:hypothetical protein